MNQSTTELESEIIFPEKFKNYQRFYYGVNTRNTTPAHHTSQCSKHVVGETLWHKTVIHWKTFDLIHAIIIHYFWIWQSKTSNNIILDLFEFLHENQLNGITNKPPKTREFTWIKTNAGHK